MIQQNFFSKNQRSTSRLLRYIYSLIQYTYLPIEDYMKNGDGLLFETLYVNHLKNCILRKKNKQNQIKINLSHKNCFCEKYGNVQYDQLSRSDVMGIEYRANFIIGYINYLFDNFFAASTVEESTNIEIQACYAFFQMEIAQTPSKAYSQILLLRNALNKTNSSYWLQFQIQQLIEAIFSEFRGFFHSVQYQNQRLNISLVFEYEQIYYDLKKTIKQALNEQQKFYEFLNSDSINLQMLQKIGNMCLQNNNTIEQKVVLMFDIHPFHQRTQSLAEIYQEFFDFRKRPVRYFANRSRQILKSKLMKFDTKINLFMKNTCSIFISLIDQKKILRITNTATKFFKCVNSYDLIGKPISVLTPDWIQDKIYQMLHMLQEEGNMQLIKLGEYFTFMRDFNLDIFPVTIRAQLSLISNQQFGLSLFIQKLENHDKYLICDSGYRIINQSQNYIHQYHKQNSYFNSNKKNLQNQDYLKEIDIRFIIPLIFSFNLNNISDINGLEGYEDSIGFRKLHSAQSQIYSTLLLLPKNGEKHNQQQKIDSNNNPYVIEKYLNEIDFENFHFSVISFSAFKIKDQKNQLGDLFILEILKIKQLRRVSELNEQLQLLQINFHHRFPTYQIKIPLLQQNQSNDLKLLQPMQAIQEENLIESNRKIMSQEIITKGNEERKRNSSHYRKTPESNKAEEKPVRRLSKQINLENLLAQEKSIILQNKINLNAISTQDMPSTKRYSDNILSPKVGINQSAHNLLSPSLVYQESISRFGQQDDNTFSNYQDQNFIDNGSDKTNNFQYKSTFMKMNTNFNLSEKLYQSNNVEDLFINEEDNHTSSSENTSKISNADQVFNFGKDDENSEESSTREHKHQFIDDSSSINSTQSQIFSKRRSLFDMVLKSKKSKEILLAKLIGFLSLIILLFVTTFLYWKLSAYFKLEQKYFIQKGNSNEKINNKIYSYLIQGPKLFEEYLQILKATEMQTIISVDKLYHYMPASKFNITDQIFYLNESTSKLNDLTEQLGIFHTNLKNDGLEDFMVFNRSSIAIQNVIDLKTKNYTFSRLYQLMNLPSNMMQYTKFGKVDSRTFVYNNYQSFIDIFSNILLIQEDLAKEQLQNTKDLIILSFAIYEVACLLSSLIILPLYYIIQQKNETILKLLATFNPDFLNFMIDKHRQASHMDILNNVNQQYQQVNSLKSRKDEFVKLEPRSLKNTLNLNGNGNTNLNKKKRQVSKVNQLQKFSLQVSLISFIVFIIISLYSIINYLITQDFFENFNSNISELSLVAQTKSQISLSSAALSLLYNSYAYNFDEASIQLIITVIKIFVEEDLNSKIQQFSSIQEHFTLNSRSFIPNYKDILLETVNQNACSILSDEYIKKYSNIKIIDGSNVDSYAKCINSYEDVLEKGLVVTLNLIVQKFNSLEQVFVNTKDKIQLFFYQVAMWDMQNNYKKFDKLYYDIRVILDTLSQFMVTSSNEYLDYLQYIQFALFLYSIVVTTIVLMFIWNKYVSWIDKTVFKTISLLSLIPIENQLENPYILSYLNKEKTKMKKQ